MRLYWDNDTCTCTCTCTFGQHSNQKSYSCARDCGQIYLFIWGYNVYVFKDISALFVVIIIIIIIVIAVIIVVVIMNYECTN